MFVRENIVWNKKNAFDVVKITLLIIFIVACMFWYKQSKNRPKMFGKTSEGV